MLLSRVVTMAFRESCNYHLEAILALALRISDKFEGDVIFLQKYHSNLTLLTILQKCL